MPADPQFNAIVLAADRGPGDPVAVAAGVPAKCLTPIAGTPMVLRVVRALRQSARVDVILLCGPAPEVLRDSPELRELIDGARIRWIRPQGSPSASAAAALADLSELDPRSRRVPVHPLQQPSPLRELGHHGIHGAVSDGSHVPGAQRIRPVEVAGLSSLHPRAALSVRSSRGSHREDAALPHGGGRHVPAGVCAGRAQRHSDAPLRAAHSGAERRVPVAARQAGHEHPDDRRCRPCLLCGPQGRPLALRGHEPDVRSRRPERIEGLLCDHGPAHEQGRFPFLRHQRKAGLAAGGAMLRHAGSRLLRVPQRVDRQRYLLPGDGHGRRAWLAASGASIVAPGPDTGINTNNGAGTGSLMVDKSVLSDNTSFGVFASGTNATVHVRESTVMRSGLAGLFQQVNGVVNTCNNNLVVLNGHGTGQRNLCPV